VTSHLKQGLSGITCASSRCTTGECCETRTCCSESSPFDQSDVACTQGRTAKTGVCGAACGASCTETTCCDDTCVTFLSGNSCSGGTSQKSNAASLLCSNGPGSACTNDYCCVPSGGNPTCAQQTPKCGVNDVLKPDLGAVTCAGQSCTPSDCCTARTCCSESSPFDQSDVTCTQGRSEKTGVCGLSCGVACTEVDCCDNTCETFIETSSGCTGPRRPKSDISSILCSGGTDSKCDVDLCCEPAVTCGDNFNCGDLTPKGSAIRCAGASCTTEECCDNNCKNAIDNEGLTCGVGDAVRQSGFNVVCGGKYPACDRSVCCVAESPACSDPCDLTCDEISCQSSTEGSASCATWSDSNRRNSDGAPVTKTRPSLCDIGSTGWFIYPHEHNCGCKIAHANGCNQCREGYWQLDVQYPCLCTSVIPNCVASHDGRGCDRCATGFHTVTCPLWKGYRGNAAGTFSISVCSDNTKDDGHGRQLPDPNCDQWFAAYDAACYRGVNSDPCFDNSWPVPGTRERDEFEDCTAVGVTCKAGLTCHQVNYFYKQCRSTNKDCPSNEITISPPGLAHETQTDITLTVWYTRAGSCSTVSCSQAGSYRGTVDICCGADDATIFQSWTSGGDCHPASYCAGNNVTFTDGQSVSRQVEGWHAEGGQEDLYVNCPDGLEGTVRLRCPNNSSTNPIGTLVYISDTCKEACYPGSACDVTEDCCGNLECADRGEGVQNLCVAPAPTCTLGDTSGIANIGDTSGCTGTIRDDECTIACAQGFIALGCPQCLNNGGEFSFRNFRCVAEDAPGIPSRPICQCNSYSDNQNYDRNKFMCQGPAYIQGKGITDENSNQDFAEDQICFDRPGVTQLLNEGTDEEISSGRCGDASGKEIHWGKEGLCQLAWECELPVTCDTQKRDDQTNFWTTAECQNQHGDNTWVAKGNLGVRGCGMNAQDCNKMLCCEQITCGSFLFVDKDGNAANSCASGTYPVNDHRPCVNGLCDQAQCCGRICDGYACIGTGVVNPIEFINHVCTINAPTTDPDHCEKKCCVATCDSATSQPGFCDSPFVGMTPSTVPRVMNTICSFDDYTKCDPLQCCEFARCSDVFEADSTFCTSAGLTDVAFNFAPCGASINDCSTNTCCRATCGDYCSAGEAARRGDGDVTANCFWPSDPDLTNSTLSRVANIECRNENVECGLTVEKCSQSLCCQIYYPEFPGNDGGAPDSTYQGQGNDPYTPVTPSVGGAN